MKVPLHFIEAEAAQGKREPVANLWAGRGATGRPNGKHAHVLHALRRTPDITWRRRIGCGEMRGLYMFCRRAPYICL